MTLADRVKEMVRWVCQQIRGRGNPHTPTPAPTARQSYLLTALVGAFSIGGQAAALTYDAHEAQNYTLTAGTGSFAITGRDAGLSGSTHVLGASKGVFGLTGIPASLRRVGNPRAESGSFAIAGKAATLRRGRKLPAAKGTFTIDGKAMALGYSATATDPEAILDNNLSAVYHLAETTGPAVSTFKTPALNAADLPIGVSVSVIEGTSSPCLRINGSTNFTGWDFRGYAVRITGSGLSGTYTDCLFQPDLNNSYSAFYGGTLDGASNVSPTFVRCTFDGTTTRPVGQGAQTLISGNWGHLSFDDCKFVNASMTYFNFDSGTLSMTNVYMGGIGLRVNPATLPHFEHINIAGGTITIDRLLIDCGDHDDDANLLTDPYNYGPSALLFWQARKSAVTGTVSNSVILPRDLHTYYGQQANNDVHGVGLTYTNCVLQIPIPPGSATRTGGYFANAATIHGSGNRDFDSGALIVGTPNI